MSNITVREANTADAAVLCRLNVAFNGDGLPGEEAIREALARNPQEVTCVAECDGRAVGFICAQVQHSWCYARPCMEITELYVEEAYRRQGVGQKLMSLVEAIGAQRFGADGFKLLTGRANLTAQAFYESQGYQKDNEVHYTKR
ncbi:MAG: GNAT family N-acetyltransferase [Clostridia bacterium]|nr:GNAT family N-acetyltransferase [Clostridia bacterium]